MRRDPKNKARKAPSRRIARHSGRTRLPASFNATSLPLLGIFENTSDVIALTDKNGTYLHVSGSVRTQFGHSPKDLLGKRGIILIHPEDRPRASAMLAKILKTKSDVPVMYELRARHKDNEWHWYQIRSNNMLAVPGVWAVVSVFHDVSDRKRQLEALRQSEERYKVFITHSSEGICRYELGIPVSISWPVRKQAEHFLRHARMAECNDAMARMYGFKRARDLIGAPITSFLNPSNPDHMKVVHDFIKSGYKIYDAEIRESDKDGNIKYFLINFMGIVEGAGGSRAWGTKRDITERKRAELRLKEGEERFRVMADQAPVMIWLAGTNKLCYWFNKVWLDYTGRSMGQEIGSGWADGVHPDDAARCLDIYSKNFDARLPYRMEYRLKRSDGTYHWILSNGIPIFSADGTFEGYIGSCIDIHEMRLAEERKDEFIGIASHELKTPITTVKVYLQVLAKMAEAKKDPKLRGHLAKMEVQVDKLTNLIRDLLDISKIQAGKLELIKTSFKIDDLVRETAEMLQAPLETHRLETRLAAKTEVYVDYDRIVQVLINLITNAVKYSPKAKKVVIATAAKNGKVILSVTDYGIGISEEHKGKVFDRFFRVEGMHEKTYPGFGMGLYISSEIIRRHGGRIAVESAPGKGSTFSFTLPLAKDKREAKSLQGKKKKL